MNFTAHSVWEMTKLFIRDPGEASRRVLLADLPLNVSVLMMVLAGVASGVISAVVLAVLGPQEMTLQLSDGSELVLFQASPIMTGVMSTVLGLGFAYLLYWVGLRAGGVGSLPQVMSVIAALQIALTVLTLAALAAEFILPLVGFMLSLLVVFVSIRGLGHAVKEGHQFAEMGRAVIVIFGSIVAMFMILIFVTSIVGLVLPGVSQ